LIPSGAGGFLSCGDIKELALFFIVMVNDFMPVINFYGTVCRRTEVLTFISMNFNSPVSRTKNQEAS